MYWALSLVKRRPGRISRWEISSTARWISSFLSPLRLADLIEFLLQQGLPVLADEQLGSR